MDMARWTRIETAIFLIYSFVFTAIFYSLDLFWFKIPWTPFALIGSAMAFVIGFQNNSAYDRIWEARKIWGGIVNASRSFGDYVQQMVNNDYADLPIDNDELYHIKRTLIYRHIAWMTALRHSMRKKKPWEVTTDEKTNTEWASLIKPPEYYSSFDNDVQDYLTPEDLAYLKDKNNKQTAILYLQSAHLQQLKEQGLIWEFSYLEIQNLIKEFFALQGKSERIKNFPYPRHFASLNHYFVRLFIALLPFGIVPQLMEVSQEIINHGHAWGKHFVWLAVPLSAIVMWVFHTMERIGRTGENPFEGTANDVPISTISRGIEIDLRQNLGEANEVIPEQFQAHYDTEL